MATSSVVIAGATYPDVPSVTLKDTSNTDVSFVLTSDADATASDIRKNKIAYANGQKIVGDYELNLQEKTVTPTKSTQTITPDSGYLLSSVVVNPIPSEYIIPNLQTRTGVTPTKSSQTITPSSGYDGLASVQINAIPSNYIDTTDATATASDIRTGKSGYVNGSKVNGSLVVNKVYVGSTDPASSFGNDGDIYIKVV